MSEDRFDPARDIVNAATILVDGSWPNFHDAELHAVELQRGDIRPEDDVWIGPSLTVDLELAALAEPFHVRLEFRDIEDLSLRGFSSGSSINDLRFELEGRGFLRTGEPMTPWVRVRFDGFEPLVLSLKCLAVEVLERREIESSMPAR